MYDSSGSDSEDEQRETEKRDRLKKLHEQLKSVLIINILSENYIILKYFNCSAPMGSKLNENSDLAGANVNS